MVICQAIDESLVQLIIAQRQFCYGADNGDFSGIGKGRPSTRNSKIAELNDLASFPIDFKKTVTAVPVLIDEPDEFFLQRLHAQRVPFSIIRTFDVNQTELAN
jgi:hypothetical protein